MPVIKLTQQFINTALCPSEVKRIEYVDTETRKMYYLLSSTTEAGQGTFYLRSKIDGKTVHSKIGRASELDLAQARGEAKRLAAEIQLGRNPQAESHARKDGLTFGDFFNDHYMPYVKPRKRSWKRDEELFRLRIEKVLGSTKLDRITRQQLQLFHTDLRAEGLAPATCDHHIKLVKHALNLAIDWGMLMEKNPAARIPLFNADNKVEHYMDDAQLDKLMHVLRTHENKTVCAICMFAMSTGARCGEILKATWDQIDRVNRVWRIPASNSKSKRIRSVPLNDSALAVLEQLDTEGKHPHLFINPKTEAPYTTITKSWERIRKIAGVPHLRIHDLRHQFASFLVNSGRTLYEVQTILGHSDVKVTQRYAHLSSKALQDAANCASVIMAGASNPQSPNTTVTPGPRLVESGPQGSARKAA